MLQYVAMCCSAAFRVCRNVCCSVLQAIIPKGLIEIEANVRYDSFMQETLCYFEIKRA